MRFCIFQDSLVGGRRNNQDRVAHAYSKDALLMVIADGMGGHVQGEVAAHITVSLLTERFQEQAVSVLRRPQQFLEESLLAAHAAIGTYASERGMIESPRTTCVACVVQNGSAWWAHAGDSRLYLFRGGELFARTRDHSRVQRLMDAGLITPEAALSHPDRNRIYSCLGGVLPPRVDLSEEVPIQAGDAVVLSTDGFWTMQREDEIARALSAGPISTALQEQLREAERRGGPEGDNLTVLGMTWESQGRMADRAAVSTDAMAPDTFTTQFSSPFHDKLGPADDISEEEIERTVAEIQNAIKKFAR